MDEFDDLLQNKKFLVIQKNRLKKDKVQKPYLFSKLKLYRRPGSNRHVREDTGF